MRPVKLLLIFIVIVFLAGAYFCFSPEVFSYFPHALHVTSSSYSVRGVYYVLPLSGVDSISLDSRELKVKGEPASWCSFLGLREISRTLPTDLAPSNVMPEGQTKWWQSDVIMWNGGDEWTRTFVNRQTLERFSLGDPFNSAYQIRKQYHGGPDTSIMVFAFGKKGQDPTTWMGYILITK